MKIKTITCHDVYNYGASLQAYALQNFLIALGHEVEIIDYHPKYKHFFNFFKIQDKGLFGYIKNIVPILEPFCALIQHVTWIKYIPMIWHFKRFKRLYLNCTKRQYESIEDAFVNKPQADLFIAGSDQIWNTAFKNGLDPMYYCMFESNVNKCIAYAASFGISVIPLEHQNFVKKCLSNFRSISIREKSGVDLARQLGFSSINVLDPVFLLDKEIWEKIIHKQHKEEYLLVYDFAIKDSQIDEVVQKISKERKLKIYTFCTFKFYADKTILNCGPIEFLEWISGASIVLSNSFHATAFSIIFQKDFYTFPLKGHENSSRMKDLLEMINLDDRYLDDLKKLNLLNHIDYEVPLKKLEQLQNVSKEWLVNNIDKNF